MVSEEREEGSGEKKGMEHWYFSTRLQAESDGLLYSAPVLTN